MKKMNEEVEKIRKYLKRKSVDVTEDEIIEAAIRIATRWGGKWTFVCELKKLGDGKDESNK